MSHLRNEEGIRGFNKYSYAVNNPYKYTYLDGKTICGGICMGVATVITIIGGVTAVDNIAEGTAIIGETGDALKVELRR